MALTLRSNRSQTGSIGLRYGLFAGHGRTLALLQEVTHRKSSMAGGIVMLEGHDRMSLQEGYHMREKDVFPLTHSVEIACNDNKLSPMML